MSIASSLAKLSFCWQFTHTPGTLLRLVRHSWAAA